MVCQALRALQSTPWVAAESARHHDGHLQVGDCAPGKAQTVCQAFQGLHKAAPGRLDLLLQVVKRRVQVVEQLGDAWDNILGLDLIKKGKGRVLQ